MASIPYLASNRFSYGVAVGNHQNSNTLAGGIQYKTYPNTTIRLNVSLDSSRNASLAVGVRRWMLGGHHLAAYRQNSLDLKDNKNV